jgi:hypothetical protein
MYLEDRKIATLNGMVEIDADTNTIIFRAANVIFSGNAAVAGAISSPIPPLTPWPAFVSTPVIVPGFVE